MLQAKLSQKYQVVIPKEAREAMSVKAGDSLIVEAINGVTLIIPKKKKMSQMLLGISKGLFSHDYLNKERESW